MQWLIIKITSDSDQLPEYALLDNKQDKAQWRQLDAAHLGSLASRRRSILLIPGEDIFTTRLKLPATNARQLAKAIPYAIEDMVAEDIDELHIVHHQDKKTTATYVAAIRSSLLDTWLERIQRHGITLHAVLSDVYALPLSQDSDTVLFQQGRCLVRTSTLQAHVFPQDLAPQVLPDLLDNTDQQLLFGNADNAAVEIELDADKKIRQLPDLHQYCHRSLLDALPLNLKQNHLQPGQSSGQNLFKPWKAVAGLALACALLWATMTGWENYQLQQRVDQLDASIATIFKQTFPELRIDSDYRVNHATMAEQLKALGRDDSQAASSALQILDRIAPTLKKNPQVQVRNVLFNGDSLSLSVKAPGNRELENLRTALDQNTVNAEIESSTTSADKVDAVMNISLEQS